ncbi:MAG: hypothetical protein WBO46_05745 [Caldilineaceae bacterium]
MSDQSKPQSFSELYPGKYLKASDLQGKSYTLRIMSVSVEKLRQFDGTQAWKVVLTFDKAQKLLILNKTQCKALTDITGSEQFQSWQGVTVKLSPVTAQNGKPTIHIAKVRMTDSLPKPEEESSKPASLTDNSEASHEVQTVPVLPLSSNGTHNSPATAYQTAYRD